MFACRSIWHSAIWNRKHGPKEGRLVSDIRWDEHFREIPWRFYISQRKLYILWRKFRLSHSSCDVIETICMSHTINSSGHICINQFMHLAGSCFSAHEHDFYALDQQKRSRIAAPTGDLDKSSNLSLHFNSTHRSQPRERWLQGKFYDVMDKSSLRIFYHTKKCVSALRSDSSGSPRKADDCKFFSFLCARISQHNNACSITISVFVLIY